MRRTSLYQTQADVDLIERLAAALAARPMAEPRRDYGTTRVIRIALRHLAGALGVEVEDRGPAPRRPSGGAERQGL